MASRSSSLRTSESLSLTFSREFLDALELSDEYTTSELSTSTADEEPRYFDSWFPWSPQCHDDNLLEDIQDTTWFDLAVSQEYGSDPVAKAFMYASGDPSVSYHYLSAMRLPMTIKSNITKFQVPVVDNWSTVRLSVADVEIPDPSLSLAQKSQLPRVKSLNDSSRFSPSVFDNCVIEDAREKQDVAVISSSEDDRIDLSSVPTQDLSLYLPTIPSLASWRELKAAHDAKHADLESSVDKPPHSHRLYPMDGLKRSPAIRRKHNTSDNFTSVARRTSATRQHHERRSLPTVGSSRAHRGRTAASLSFPRQYSPASRTPNATLKENIIPCNRSTTSVDAVKDPQLVSQLLEATTKNSRTSLLLSPVTPLTIYKHYL